MWTDGEARGLAPWVGSRWDFQRLGEDPRRGENTSGEGRMHLNNTGPRHIPDVYSKAEFILFFVCLFLKRTNGKVFLFLKIYFYFFLARWGLCCCMGFSLIV